MPQRIAGITSLIVFVGCLVTGAFGAENSFVTAVERALVAMTATLIIGLIVGYMAQRMINENVDSTVKAAAAPVAETTTESGPVAVVPSVCVPSQAKSTVPAFWLPSVCV